MSHMAVIICKLEDILGHLLFMSTLRILDSAFRYSQKTEKEKKEIRAWMKRKQKERMREYMKKVDEQRQKEHNPFNFKKYTVRKMLILRSSLCIVQVLIDQIRLNNSCQ